MAYKSKYLPKNKQKYLGDPTKIITRSTWEWSLAKWCDNNPLIKKWSVENVVVPYYDTLKKKQRRYFVDFYVETNKGEKLLIEVKPNKETKPPFRFKNKHEDLLEILQESQAVYSSSALQKKYRAVITYMTNQSKWKAAKKYADKRNWKFVVWTEEEFKQLGIPIITKLKCVPSIRKKRYTNKRKTVNGY